MRTLLIGLIRDLSLWPESAARQLPFLSELLVLPQQSIDRHGAMRGLVLAVRRIASCHPWNPGGYDPVPDAASAPLSRTLHG
jgi:putative component of membrane protein insertase Oxa1/YidC/SpoIIIJ protein YidD